MSPFCPRSEVREGRCGAISSVALMDSGESGQQAKHLTSAALAAHFNYLLLCTPSHTIGIYINDYSSQLSKSHGREYIFRFFAFYHGFAQLKGPSVYSTSQVHHILFRRMHLAFVEMIRRG